MHTLYVNYVAVVMFCAVLYIHNSNLIYCVLYNDFAELMLTLASINIECHNRELCYILLLPTHIREKIVKVLCHSSSLVDDCFQSLWNLPSEPVITETRSERYKISIPHCELRKNYS